MLKPLARTLVIIATLVLAPTALAAADAGTLVAPQGGTTMGALGCGESFAVPADAQVPHGSVYLFVLSDAGRIHVIQSADSFCVARVGTYQVHGLVAPDGFDLARYATLDELRAALRDDESGGALTRGGVWLGVTKPTSASSDLALSRDLVTPGVAARCPVMNTLDAGPALRAEYLPEGTYLVYVAVEMDDTQRGRVLAVSEDGDWAPADMVVFWYAHGPIMVYPTVTMTLPEVLISHVKREPSTRMAMLGL